MSIFAKALANLLDNTNLFTRREWAKFAGVTEDKIEGWLKDEDIPRPYTLSLITLCLKNCSDVNQSPVIEFEKISELRSTLVSPYGDRMLPTIKEYYSRPIFSDISSKLAKLTLEEQGNFLLEMYPEKNHV